MKISEEKTMVLFRCHENLDIAKERIKIIKHFNPFLPVYVLFGGSKNDYKVAIDSLKDLVEHVWFFNKQVDSTWKWTHTDIMTKKWFKDFGSSIDFDFLYSYEYDLLTLTSLEQIYPDINSNSLGLAAVTKLNAVEQTWGWTSQVDKRQNYLKFREYMENTYGLHKQKYVCLGPGPLLPRKFLEKFSVLEDVEWVHEEISLPAYAEVLGFKLIDHGMHPGFNLTPEEKFFSCRANAKARKEDILEQINKPEGRRAFHPVKYMVTLEDFIS